MIEVKAKNRLRKDRAIDALRKMPVIRADKDQKNKYLTFVHHLDKLRKICMADNLKLFLTDKVEDAYDAFQRRINAIKKAKESREFVSSLWTKDEKYKVLDYQAQAINVCMRARKYLIGDDMGLGKTIEAIGVICKSFELDYNKFLIICPNRLKYQWLSEIQTFTQLPHDQIAVCDPYRKHICPLGIVSYIPNFRSRECKNCDRIDKCKREKYDPMIKFRSQIANKRVSIVNYEIVEKFKDILIGQQYDGLIIDEASRMKNIGTLTTKAILKIAKEMSSDAIIIPMSGTFIENRVEEIYPALTLVHKGILGEFHSFKNNYLVHDFWGNVIGHRNIKRLRKLIDMWIIRRSIEEVWKDRPPLIETTKVCKMTEKQRKIYLDARDGALRELNDKTKENKINMAEVGALLSYLIQICDTTETVDKSIQESGKIDALKEIVENDIAKRHKVLIFSFFANKVIPVIIREMSKYGKCLSITGGVGAERAEKIKRKFTRMKKYKFLICSDSMAYGANLQAARYVINFDLPWNPAKIDQRIHRVYRKGQEHTVTVINLVTTNSVEDMILEKIGFKRKIFDQFLGTVKQSGSLSVNDMIQILKSKPQED